MNQWKITNFVFA